MNKMIKPICLVLLGGFFLSVIISCSPVRHFLGWSDRPGSKEATIDGFLSNIRPQPGNPDSHYLLACYYQERGRNPEALEEFKKTLLIDPGYVKAYNGMGVSFDLMGDFSRAIESYQTALRLNLDLDYVQNNLGYSYLLQGNIDEAIRAFQKAIALNGQENRFRNNLGLAYAGEGQFDLALAQFKKGGDEAKAHYNLAQVFFKKGLYHEAKDHYAKALALNPSLIVVQTGLDAANALVRIFEPENKNPVVKALVMPDQPVTPLLSPAKYPDAKQTIAEIPPEGQIEAGILTQETPLIRMETTIVRIEDPKQSEHPKSSKSATVKSQPPASNGNGARVADILSLKKAGIEISNGNGVNRMAWRVGNYLKEKGLSVVRLTNADHFNHNETIIYYQNGQRESVDLLADYLPVNFDKEEIKKLDRPDIKIKVLIGKDLVPKNKVFENNNGTRKKQG